MHTHTHTQDTMQCLVASVSYAIFNSIEMYFLKKIFPWNEVLLILYKHVVLISLVSFL